MVSLIRRRAERVAQSLARISSAKAPRMRRRANAPNGTPRSGSNESAEVIRAIAPAEARSSRERCDAFEHKSETRYPTSGRCCVTISLRSTRFNTVSPHETGSEGPRPLKRREPHPKTDRCSPHWSQRSIVGRSTHGGNLSPDPHSACTLRKKLGEKCGNRPGAVIRGRKRNGAHERK